MISTRRNILNGSAGFHGVFLGTVVPAQNSFGLAGATLSSAGTTGASPSMPRNLRRFICRPTACTAFRFLLAVDPSLVLVYRPIRPRLRDWLDTSFATSCWGFGLVRFLLVDVQSAMGLIVLARGVQSFLRHFRGNVLGQFGNNLQGHLRLTLQRHLFHGVAVFLR